MKHLFTDYIHPNLNVGKKTISWPEIQEKNVTMVGRSFLKLCRYKCLITNLLNIEELQKFMEQTLPPVSNAEMDFYTKQTLRKAYDNDKNYQTTMVEPIRDKNTGELQEPVLHFHEFLFLLGLIAYYCIDTSEQMPGKLRDFYIEKLNFRKVAQADYDLNYDEVLQKYERGDPDSYEDGSDEEWDEEEEFQDEEAFGNQQAIMDLVH